MSSHIYIQTSATRLLWHAWEDTRHTGVALTQAWVGFIGAAPLVLGNPAHCCMIRCHSSAILLVTCFAKLSIGVGAISATLWASSASDPFRFEKKVSKT